MALSRKGAPLVRRRAVGVAATAGLFLALFGVAGCQGVTGGSPVPPSVQAGGSTAPAAAPPPLEAPARAQSPAGGAAAATPVLVTHPPLALDDDGYLSSLYVERDVRVTARRTGIIEQVLVDRGERVRAGQALAQIESDVAARELELAEQELRLAQADFERLISLNAAKVVSSQEFQRAEITRDLKQTRVALARAQLDRCTVQAPFDGLIVERWAVPGQRVEVDDSAPLFRIAANEPLRAHIDLPEEQAQRVKVGDRALLEPAGGASAHPGRVVFVGPASDAASGTVPVIVQLLGAGPSLPLGAAVRVRLMSPRVPASVPIRLPHDALLDPSALDGDRTSVFLAIGGKAVSRQVTVVKVEGGTVTVRGEISPQDNVIVSAGGLSAGDPVMAREAP